MTAEPTTRSGKILVHSRWITTRKTGNILSKVRFPKKKKKAKRLSLAKIWSKKFKR